MKKKTRISSKVSEFNPYINNTADYLDAGTPKNGERLGLTLVQIGEWLAARDTWRDDLFPKYTNDDLKTKTVVLQVKNFIKTFRTAANQMLNQMASNPAATEQDEETLNFKRTRKPPTHSTTPIAELCYATVIMKGNGNAQFNFRTESDTARPSLPESADSVQIALKGGTVPPAHPGDGTAITTITKARFLFHYGTAVPGNSLYLYCRWFHTKHPELAGPWSALVTVTMA